MIINFSVAGFLSIKDKQELTFSSFHGQRIKGTRYEENYILSSPYKEAKSTVIFGNNAVGKTNLLLAIKACKDVIVTGNLIEEEQLFNYDSSRMSFAIDVSTRKGDSYSYTVVFDRNHMIEEAFLKNDTIVYQFKGNQLFSNQLEDQVKEIFSISSSSTLLRKLKDFIVEEYREFVDTIKSIEVVTDELINSDFKQYPIMMSESEKDLIEHNKDLSLLIIQQLDRTVIDLDFELSIAEGNVRKYQCKLIRTLGDGQQIPFYVAYESKGIKRIIKILTGLLKVCEGRTIVIDELDASISTRSLILLFNQIINSSRNQKGQLIVTTHNLELFDIQLFAPEQMYIVNKDNQLATIVYSLADFDIRSNKKRLSLDFMQGKFEVV